MPQRLHTFLFLALDIAGFITGAILFDKCATMYHFTGWRGTLIFFSVISFCTYIPFTLFKDVIPAQCPKCKGKMRVTAIRPITYACQSCNYSHESRVSFGKGGKKL